MTIDARIEKLTARHEALTQSVELLTHQSIGQGERIDKILHAISEDAENIRALARIAQAHETRLDRIEDSQ